jgi:hypothetical protein
MNDGYRYESTVGSSWAHGVPPLLGGRHPVVCVKLKQHAGSMSSWALRNEWNLDARRS